MSNEAGTITVVMDVNAARMYREFEKAKAKTKQAGRKMSGTMAKSMRRVGTAMKGMAIGMALAFGRNLIGNITEAGLAMDRFGRTFRVAMGSAKAAAEEMVWVTNLSNRLGVNLLVAAASYAKLTAAAKGTALAGRGTRDIFEALSEATMVLGLSAQDTGQILTAVEQMISKGKVAAEELRRQMQKLPGAFQMAARAMDMTTAALDKALKNGEVLAQEMLPGLSRELKETFGPELTNAMNQPQAVFGRYANSIIQLKASIAQSGLLELLTAIAEKATDWAKAIKFVNDKHRELDARDTLGKLRESIAPKFDELKEARRKLAQFKEQMKEVHAVPKETVQKNLKVLADEVIRLEKEYKGLKEAAVLAHKAMQGVNIANSEQDAADAANALPEGWDAFIKKHMPPGMLADQLFAELQLMKPHILETYPGMYEMAMRSILAISDKGTDALVAKYGSQMQIAALKASKAIKDIMAAGFDPATYAEMIKRVHEEFERATELKEIIPIVSFKKDLDEMSEYAKQAAKNMQDAFADFLFDPFEDGLKGMLKGFLDVIRRMVAESAAADIFGSGSGLSGFLDGLMGRANGGPVSAGTPYLVGEKGPEIMVPGAGYIIPNSALGGGGISVVQNYSIAAGADWETLQKVLPPMFDQNREATIGQIRQLRAEGAM